MIVLLIWCCCCEYCAIGSVLIGGGFGLFLCAREGIKLLAKAVGEFVLVVVVVGDVVVEEAAEDDREEVEEDEDEDEPAEHDDAVEVGDDAAEVVKLLFSIARPVDEAAEEVEFGIIVADTPPFEDKDGADNEELVEDALEDVDRLSVLLLLLLLIRSEMIVLLLTSQLLGEVGGEVEVELATELQLPVFLDKSVGSFSLTDAET